MPAMAAMPRVDSHSGSACWLRQLLGRRGTSRTIRPAHQTFDASSSWSVQPVLPMWGYVRVTSWRAYDGSVRISW